MPICLTCPVLSIQVRLQTQNTYQGIVDCVVKTYRHESVGSPRLWGQSRLGQGVVVSFCLLLANNF